MVPGELPMEMVRKRLPVAARWTYVVLGTYCAQHLTDGVIDVPLRMLDDDPDIEAHVEALIAADLIERRDDDTLFLPRFLDHNKDAQAMERMRAEARVRKERWERHRQDDHSICTDRCSVRKRHNAGDHGACTDWCDLSGNVGQNVLGTFQNASYLTGLEAKRSEASKTVREQNTGGSGSAPTGATPTPPQAVIDALQVLRAMGAKEVDARQCGDEWEVTPTALYEPKCPVLLYWTHSGDLWAVEVPVALTYEQGALEGLIRAWLQKVAPSVARDCTVKVDLDDDCYSVSIECYALPQTLVEDAMHLQAWLAEHEAAA